ncbi:UNVERIFIED_CONTAM: hypothetical protein RKD50_003026 [Streptomyces canus]|jgi:hypothetical protein
MLVSCGPARASALCCLVHDQVGAGEGVCEGGSEPVVMDWMAGGQRPLCMPIEPVVALVTGDGEEPVAGRPFP